VLGTKIFYDGAVWQELSLQEVDKTKIVWYNIRKNEVYRGTIWTEKIKY
jgi:hypothetical protein